ncbi:MAG: cytochrome c biogenesis heme-transporting ATPase CcmA [Thiotrichales bacterium]|nr:cytochrome c biogenesis heme-transporting ATPase CcmA [Thiotrichales bacterium]
MSSIYPAKTGTSRELHAENLSYEINDKLIINNLSLSVKSGEILYIEGSNGSGKTTLLRLLCGLMQSDAGTVTWDGTDINDDRLEFTRQLTFIGHNTGVKAELSTEENIRFFSSLSGLNQEVDTTAAIEWAGLRQHMGSPGRHLSYGQQRRIALTRLMMEPSKLWVLDEPFSGLDQDMIARLQAHFAGHVQKGGLLILTSHQHIELSNANTVRIRLEHH